MGHGWRRVMETVRQKVRSDRTFIPTSNARNEAMLKEATEFCTQLRALERDLRSTHKDIDGKFASLRNILQSPLPRAYDEDNNGTPVPCTEGLIIGQGINTEALQQAASDLKLRIEDEVIKPLRSWLGIYRDVCERMAKLEQLRLELDSRRRTVDSLTEKLERLEKTQPPPQQKEKEKHEQELERVAQLLQHKRDKLTHTQHAYRDLENTVFNSLQALIKDTGVLRDYAGLALQIIQDCYQKGYAAFGTATPLHDYHSTSDAMYQQQFQNMAMNQRAQSERATLIRQMTAPTGARTAGGASKEGDRAGVALYAAAMDDVAGDAMPYDQQMQQQGPYVDPAGQGTGGAINPYQNAYQASPHHYNRIMTSPVGGWQGQAIPY
ncbi:hypothetical protein GPECTOR_80g143 [Gonium pectorale]|uniref:BAR domain-containing protein n=1 Tax=Gonium pectorale TaxID=33097 RepID=A0A150G1S9_GONPE|nr:hypothetical protein GPECTOR_80g143 [Gonium pectorale]|eukprot:KXZ43783.1 hypothetical protein GPECTOR_80g143 [Gonium pectorale]